MFKYKIIVAYDGTDYAGWQMQPAYPTVTKILQDKFKSVFNKEIKITGASRTDAGVHALGQVASFYLDFEINSHDLLRAWNSKLPKDILIRKIELVSNDFHLRRNVKDKIYYYNILGSRPLPFFSRFGFNIKKSIDIEKLQACLDVFLGTHDFRSFCTGYDKENTIRTINSINIQYLKRYNLYQIKVVGPGFLRYMIRRIVGAATDVACNPNKSISQLKVALEQKNPAQKFPTAPACGLVLYKIIYNQ